MDTASQETARVEALDVIDGGLRGEQDLLAVCRRLVELRRRLPNPDDEAMLTVVAVESELDDIPTAAQYSKWSKAALEEKLAEKDEYLGRARTSLEAALESLSNSLRRM